MSQDHAVLLSFFVVVVVFRRSEKDRDRESEARQALESSDNCLKSGFFSFFFFFFFLVFAFQRVPKPEKSYFRAGKFRVSFFFYCFFLARGFSTLFFCFVFGRHNIVGSREASWRLDSESVCKGGTSAERTDVCRQSV